MFTRLLRNSANEPTNQEVYVPLQLAEQPIFTFRFWNGNQSKQFTPPLEPKDAGYGLSDP